MVRRTIAGLVLTAVGCLTVAGCSSDDPAAEPTARATPISRLDIGAIRLVRAEFCDRVPDAAVRDALGADLEADESWGNGDPVPGSSGTGDVGHEIGCGWSAADGSAARAWVFARPVSADLAGSLVRQAGRQKGCTAARTREFGSIALLQTCTLPVGTERVRRAGLFGDTWLTCEVTGSPDRLHARADGWCAAVVAAASG